MKTAKTFGQRLRAIRKRYGLSQAQVEAWMGWGDRYCSKLERGLHTPHAAELTLAHIRAMAEREALARRGGR